MCWSLLLLSAFSHLYGWFPHPLSQCRISIDASHSYSQEWYSRILWKDGKGPIFSFILKHCGDYLSCHSRDRTVILCSRLWVCTVPVQIIKDSVYGALGYHDAADAGHTDSTVSALLQTGNGRPMAATRS